MHLLQSWKVTTDLLKKKFSCRQHEDNKEVAPTHVSSVKTRQFRHGKCVYSTQNDMRKEHKMRNKRILAALSPARVVPGAVEKVADETDPKRNPSVIRLVPMIGEQK